MKKQNTQLDKNNTITKTNKSIISNSSYVS